MSVVSVLNHRTVSHAIQIMCSVVEPVSRAIGGKNSNQSPEASKAQSEGAKVSQTRTLRVFTGQLATARQLKAAIGERIDKYLQRMDDLTRSPDEGVALKASQYMIDRYAGKPTEKYEVEQSTPTIVRMPSQEAFVKEAERIMSGEETVRPLEEEKSEHPGGIN